jgi:Tfp pilus assembly PilM family ATPase
MLNELYKYLQNYMMRYPSCPITEIIMMGGLSNMKGLDRYIQQSLTLPCSVVKEPDGFCVRQVPDKDVGAAGRICCNFPLFTGILGAAAGGV